MNSKLITFIGAPSSGKSTLATLVHSELKRTGKNSIFINEAATDYIAEYGVPDSPLDQMVIFYKQLNREKMYVGTKDYIVCDSSSLLNYFYFRSLFGSRLSNKNIATINHMQKEILKTINSWTDIFYLPPILENTEDGIRFHKKDDIVKLDRLIRSYLDIENIPYTDLSNVKLEDRVDYIINQI
jgi:nicotinamide riboside kinase